MKVTKPHSLTADTHLSQSNFFNNSALNKTNLSQITSSSKKKNGVNIDSQMANTFNQYQSKQSDFLKVKNAQLHERVNRMSNQIRQLQDNKVYLLRLNEKYVKVVNQYYRNFNEGENGVIMLKKQLEKQKANVGNNKVSRSKSNSKYSSVQKCDQKLAEKVLSQLQKDHRNLVKHCLIMQNQIKNYAKEMEKFVSMKTQLNTVNHTTPTQLIIELQDTVEENKQLKKENNRLAFELQKSKNQCSKLKNYKQNKNKQINSNNIESEKIKAQILRITQQSLDKSNQYEQRVYELELKVQKLQKQLRNGQQSISKTQDKRKDLQIQRVENVHENSFLKANLSELLQYKKHPLMKMDRSFAYKKKKQKSISLNSTVIN